MGNVSGRLGFADRAGGPADLSLLRSVSPAGRSSTGAVRA